MRTISCGHTASVMTMFIVGLLVLAVHNVNGGGDSGDCLKDYIQVIQGTTGNLPSGTPIFSVQIINECPRDCSIAQIHLSCDSFASELLINPMIFRKLGSNDCLVNNGKPLANGAVISFKYASSAQFPLAVSSLTCLP
ncbi:TPD1 protein homolog 1-like [Quercus robur]|uniref:TPD1 protein homolog 1-like n=1 Tax=Quercus robur TaxID=38942 RepID=UPI0021614025|nr:TPD1 protein homolog 1-like [Quercus robur]